MGSNVSMKMHHLELGSLRSSTRSKIDRILEAAMTLFLSHGYGAVSMDEISKKARVSKSTLYAHFGNKEVLFRSIISCECANIAFSEAWSEAWDLPVVEGLRLIGLTYVTSITSPKALALQRVVLGGAQRFPELAQALYEADRELAFGRISAYLSEMNRRGDLSIANVDLATHQFVGLLKGELYIKLLLCISEEFYEGDIQDFVEDAIFFFMKGHDNIRA
jgi:TetR/AcrR family transcriptional regulator, mexJK operon transcriptional repressor